MHDVPSETVGEHLGFRNKESRKVDELDERLARKYSRILHTSMLQLISFSHRTHAIHLRHARVSDLL